MDIDALVRDLVDAGAKERQDGRKTSYSSGRRRSIMDCRVQKVNLLTKRKSELVLCELCSEIGRYVCVTCKVTFYCSKGHFNLDKNFHSELCASIQNVREPNPFDPIKENRVRMAGKRKAYVVDLYQKTWAKAQRALDEEKYDGAISLATTSLTLARQLYGEGEEMVIPLLIVAEAHIHKGNISLAEGFFSSTVTIEQIAGVNIRNTYKARIRHVEGLIALARRNNRVAIESFSEEIILNTEHYGPEHIKTSGGYCYLAHMFFLEGKCAVSISMYRQIVDIWITYLEPIFIEKTESNIPTLAAIAEEKDWLDHSASVDGLKILSRCYREMTACSKSNSKMKKTERQIVSDLDIARTCYALGLLLYLTAKFADSESQAMEAISKIGKSHPFAATVTLLFKSAARKSYQSTPRHSDSQGENSITLGLDDIEPGLINGKEDQNGGNFHQLQKQGGAESAGVQEPQTERKDSNDADTTVE